MVVNQIFLIRGLCGSGKSYYVKSLDLADSEYDVNYTVDLLSRLHRNSRFALTDPFLCKTDIFKSACSQLSSLFPEHIIEVIEFENDLIKASVNVKLRNDGREVTSLNKQLSLIYTPSDPIKIWQPSIDK